MKTKKVISKILVIGGLAVVYVTHIAILASSTPMVLHTQHALFNLGAAASITVGYIMECF